MLNAIEMLNKVVEALAAHPLWRNVLYYASGAERQAVGGGR